MPEGMNICLLPECQKELYRSVDERDGDRFCILKGREIKIRTDKNGERFIVCPFCKRPNFLQLPEGETMERIHRLEDYIIDSLEA